MKDMNIAKNENIVSRKIYDTIYLIDITDNYTDDKCRLYEINEIGAFIWNQINEMTSVSQIVDKLIEVITDDVDRDIIEEDVADFISILLKKNFVTECVE